MAQRCNRGRNCLSPAGALEADDSCYTTSFSAVPGSERLMTRSPWIGGKPPAFVAPITPLALAMLEEILVLIHLHNCPQGVYRHLGGRPIDLCGNVSIVRDAACRIRRWPVPCAC